MPFDRRRRSTPALMGAAVAVAAAIAATAAGATSVFSHTFASPVNRGQVNGVSTGGNLMTYESPAIAGADYEHLTGGFMPQGIEGYVLCYAPGPGLIDAWDTGVSSSGFSAPGPATIVDPAVPPALPSFTVSRTTSGATLKLKQTLSWDYAAHAVIIKMTVTNISTVAVGAITLRRLAEPFVDTAGPDGWNPGENLAADTTDSVMIWDNALGGGPLPGLTPPPGKEAHGLVLRHLSAPAGIAWTAKITPPADTSCSPPALAPVAGPGHFGQSIEYAIGTLVPGAKASVTVRYDRI